MRSSFLILFLVSAAMLNGQNSPDLFFTLQHRDMLSVSPDELDKAEELNDLHRLYRGKWVEQYYRTEIRLVDGEKFKSAFGADAKLTEEQKDLLLSANAGNEIEINVSYLPKNNLIDNPTRVMSYTYNVTPDVFAEFKGGDEAFDQYIKNTLTSKLSEEEKKKLSIGIIAFSVSEQGKVSDVSLTKSTTDEKLDTAILECFNSMPNWEPARNADGSLTAHPMVFYVSNMQGHCDIPRIEEQ